MNGLILSRQGSPLGWIFNEYGGRVAEGFLKAALDFYERHQDDSVTWEYFSYYSKNEPKIVFSPGDSRECSNYTHHPPYTVITLQPEETEFLIKEIKDHIEGKRK